MRVVTKEPELAQSVGGCFVPTMGALHAGHLALIAEAAKFRAARGLSGPIIVSIFVNPTQFNDPADLARYPRTLEADLAGCERAGADIVFAPAATDVYPNDRPVVIPALPGTAIRPQLEDRVRPGHFAGVCQVVNRLFEIVRPSVAIFGEKDWQQLAVIRQMTRALSLPIEIVGVATVREPDGLAMSSRNVFLSPADREQARAIPRALREGAAFLTVPVAEIAMRRVLERAGLEVEYAVVRDADSLEPTTSISVLKRALIAARVGKVRLIDNAPWSR